jgi:hypothetical protein
MANSAYRSTEESSSAPKREALPELRARLPSMESHRPPSSTRDPPRRGLCRKKATAAKEVMMTPATVVFGSIPSG